jgi:hypothetical protein
MVLGSAQVQDIIVRGGPYRALLTFEVRQMGTQGVPSSPVISSQSIISSQQLNIFGWAL